MIVVRYTAWDGTQRVRLDAERVIEKLSEYLGHTDDVQQALEWMLRQGLEWEDARIAGLDELLHRIREEIRKYYRRYHLDTALDEIRERLDEIVDLEREALRERELPDASQRREFLERLPHRLSEAIEKLRHYEFVDELAAQEFEELLEELDDIRNLEEFQRRYGDLFHGSESLGYEEALELVRAMQRLRELEERLLRGDLEALSLEELGEALGQGAVQDVRFLREMVLVLERAGYLTAKGRRLTLSPRGVRKIGQLALRDIYQNLVRDRSGAHGVDHRGAMEVRPDARHPYQHGDPMHLDLVATCKNALARGVRVPLELRPQDFEVFDCDFSTAASTVLLLDMSWSMSWEGRFAAAKKVAMAMESLIRTRFPRDYFGIVGFFTRAVELKIQDLPEASWNMGDPFTNLQDGLRLACGLLRRHPSNNPQIIVITDGQPTAYFSGGRLYCEWPLSFGGISMRAARETLKEVERVTRCGVTINTFMLDDSPSLRAFVEQMTRINKGRAFYTRPDRLGEYLLVDYIQRRRKKV